MPAITVRSLMSKVVEILQIGDSLADARRLMDASHVRHLPVIDGDERVVGLVTHRMVLAAWVSHGLPDLEPPGAVAREVPVEMIMEKNVVTIAPEASAADAARLLESRRFGCLPVVEGGKLVGIVTETDFVRFARRVLDRRPRPGARSAEKNARRSP